MRKIVTTWEVTHKGLMCWWGGLIPTGLPCGLSEAI